MVWIGGIHSWEDLVTLELVLLLERHLLLHWLLLLLLLLLLNHVLHWWLHLLHAVTNHSHASHILLILHVASNSVIWVTTVLLVSKSWLHVLVWTSVLTLTCLGSWSHTTLVHWASLLSKDGWETLKKQLKVVLDVLVVSKSRPVGSLVVLGTESLEVVSILSSFVVDLSDLLDFVVVDGQGSSLENKVVEFFLGS